MDVNPRHRFVGLVVMLVLVCGFAIAFYAVLAVVLVTVIKWAWGE